MKQIAGNESETVAVAERLAQQLKCGDVVTLSGELGAGKSVFARAVMRALGVTDEALPSPTFAIIQEYDGVGCRVAHMDWYRLDDPDEIEMLGVRDYMRAPWIALIEWPGRAPGIIGAQAIRVSITVDPADLTRRVIDIDSGD